jgi:hypothetical protein
VRNPRSRYLLDWRNVTAFLIAVTLPASTFGDEAAAMLRSSGQGVFVNGSPALPSVAIFANDFIEAQKHAVARIEMSGSSVTIDPETILMFDAQELSLDHGRLAVFTGRGLRVRVGCITITPANPSIETTYEVLDREGKVTVHATKSDVYIEAKSKSAKERKNPSRSRDLVRESEQKSRDEKCAGAAIKGQMTPGIGAALSSPWAIGAGVAAVGGLTLWVLCKGDDPISPSAPEQAPCPIP